MASYHSEIDIPNRVLRIFRAAFDVDVNGFKRIITLLESEKPSVDLEYFAREISKSTSISQDLVQSVLGFLWQLELNYQRSGIAASSFIDELKEYLISLNEKDWSSQHREFWDKISEDLTRFLETESNFSTSVKAGELLIEQERPFCTARIVTDIRPTLDEDAEKIKGFIIYHNLIIKYHAPREIKEFHVALDHNDLLLLEAQVARAKKKEIQLQNYLESKDIIIVDTGTQKE